jgi:MoaA/NifB/PqqE/SkfB family radical SAM enzyme
MKLLQVESTTKCNAWCPGCARNKGGFQLVDNLQLEDLSESRFEEVLKSIGDVEIIDFCGTYGDSIAANNINDLIQIAKKNCKKIILRTNGSLRNTQWWSSFGDSLKDFTHEVWFCLDGLADTHSIYRQGTDFDTIIENAKAFMSSGGNAVWQFIPWQHNQHQIKDCLRLSQQLGFARFEFIKNVRTNFKAKHYRTGEPLSIVPWSENKNFSRYTKERTTLTANDCIHLREPSLYLNANGKLSNCCYFNTSLCANTVDELPNIAEEMDNPRQSCIQWCGK